MTYAGILESWNESLWIIIDVTAYVLWPKEKEKRER